MIEEFRLENLIDGFQSKHSLGVHDRSALWCSTSFDVSMYEIFSALLSGSKLHVVHPGMRAFGDDYLEFLVSNEITSCYIPPFLVKRFCDRDIDDMRYMRRLLVGVEPVMLDVLVFAKRKWPQLMIFNGYGPTEATVCSTAYQVTGNEIKLDRYCPIGTELPGYTVAVKDAYGATLPEGEEGEIYISGVGVARGYLKGNGEDGGFVKNADDSLTFCTGDRGKVDSDGNIVFLGRSDSQVKIRGNRVDLLEVQTAIILHPSVSEALLTISDNANGKLEAHLVCLPNLSRERLIGHLIKELPSYMIPSSFIRHKSFERTLSGKVDRARICTCGVPLHTDFPFVEPSTPLETEVKKYFTKELNIENIGVCDDLKFYGMDSLMRASAFAHFSDFYRQSISAHEFLNFKTCRELASILEK